MEHNKETRHGEFRLSLYKRRRCRPATPPAPSEHRRFVLGDGEAGCGAYRGGCLRRREAFCGLLPRAGTRKTREDDSRERLVLDPPRLRALNLTRVFRHRLRLGWGWSQGLGRGRGRNRWSRLHHVDWLRHCGGKSRRLVWQQLWWDWRLQLWLLVVLLLQRRVQTSDDGGRRRRQRRAHCDRGSHGHHSDAMAVARHRRAP